MVYAYATSCQAELIAQHLYALRMSVRNDHFGDSGPMLRANNYGLYRHQIHNKFVLVRE